jgi:CRISPR-associated protein Cas1
MEMIKRVVDVSTPGISLSVRYGQLVLQKDGKHIARIPCEDISVLVCHHARTKYTHSVFTELIDRGAAVVMCGAKHHPAGLLLPLESNSLQSERFRHQVEANKPLKKRLWKQIIRTRIMHQAEIVRSDPKAYSALSRLRNKVRSGDPENIEAQASRIYWQAFLGGSGFQRRRRGPPPNNLLNYGYMIARAAVARALCSSGLLPCLGIHHRNRYNAFCLADDLLEAFRAFVETKVEYMCNEGLITDTMTKAQKEGLLSVLQESVCVDGSRTPLMIAMQRGASSMHSCFAGDKRELDLPDLPC